MMRWGALTWLLVPELLYEYPWLLGILTDESRERFGLVWFGIPLEGERMNAGGDGGDCEVKSGGLKYLPGLALE